jgi:hypothetical protein
MLASRDGGAAARAAAASYSDGGRSRVLPAGYEQPPEADSASMPATNQLAAASDEGWYSRNHRRALDNRQQQPGNLQAAPAGSLTRGPLPMTSVPDNRTMTRPLQPQTVGQINLDGGYRQPPNSAAAQPGYAVPPRGVTPGAVVPSRPAVPRVRTVPANPGMMPYYTPAPAAIPMSMAPTYFGGGCVGST